MTDSIKKVIKYLSIIRIENLIEMDDSQTDNGLYPEDYDSHTGHYLLPKTDSLRL